MLYSSEEVLDSGLVSSSADSGRRLRGRTVFLSGARPALPMGVAPEAMVGYL